MGTSTSIQRQGRDEGGARGIMNNEVEQGMFDMLDIPYRHSSPNARVRLHREIKAPILSLSILLNNEFVASFAVASVIICGLGTEHTRLDAQSTRYHLTYRRDRIPAPNINLSIPNCNAVSDDTFN